MRDIREITEPYSNRIELVYVRFPNESLPLTSCCAGDIVYVFVGGELTVCPYLVFAARSPNSRHNPDEFIVGNVLASGEIAAMLDAFDFSMVVTILDAIQRADTAHLNPGAEWDALQQWLRLDKE